jgi:hypothetical protein
MNVVYHPDVQRDVSGILRHYDRINDRLGDEFFEELNSVINQAAADPQRFHFEVRDRRRINFKRFPYHVLFREISGAFASRQCATISGIQSAGANGGNLSSTKPALNGPFRLRP